MAGAPPAPKRTVRAPRASAFADELILEVRRLREQQGMTTGKIALVLTNRGHEVSAQQVINWCNYQTRAHLVPKANAEPYLK